MIIPNLLVTDVPACVAFYRDVLGFEVSMVIDGDRQMMSGGDYRGGVFALLTWQGGELMLQDADNFRDEMADVIDRDQIPMPAATVYLRGFNPDPVLPRLPDGHLVKGPFLQWYGMREVYLRDPEGHMVVLGHAEGPPPA